MTIYLSNRDGNGKTNEEGHYKLQTAVWSGNVLGSTALQVTQNSPLGMSVLVAVGQYKIDTTDYSYTGWNNASAPVTISTADPANPRITSIVLYVDKGAATSASPPNNPGITKLIAVNGTPSAVPSAPSAGTIQTAVGAGNPYIVLANVTVAAAATQVINANISDQRTQISLSSNLVASSSIIDSSVTTSKINNLAVTTGKIDNLAVTTGKIADAAVDETKWRNNIGFYAYRAAARSLTASTFTLLAADTILWNNGSGYSNAGNAGRFTAPVNGIYEFVCNLYTEAVANTRVIIEIRKNGVGMRQVDTTATDVNRVNGTQTYSLNAGDYVEAWVWTIAATNVANTQSWFSGTLVTRT